MTNQLRRSDYYAKYLISMSALARVGFSSLILLVLWLGIRWAVSLP
ncbi:hypothetical protein [Vibrio gallicus]|nr:hypothetical protein [Vibrio gallicus]